MSSLQKAESHLERLTPLPSTLIRGVAVAEQETDPERRALANDGIGARIQAVYTGLEALIEATLGSLNEKIPKGESSHKALLDAAEEHSLISTEEKFKLDTIKGFRHIHRHTYDIILNYETLKARALSLAELLPPILGRTKEVLAKIREQNDNPPGGKGK